MAVSSKAKSMSQSLFSPIQHVGVHNLLPWHIQRNRQRSRSSRNVIQPRRKLTRIIHWVQKRCKETLGDEEPDGRDEEEDLADYGYRGSRGVAEKAVVGIHDGDDEEGAEFREEVDGFIGRPAAAEV